MWTRMTLLSRRSRLSLWTLNMTREEIIAIPSQTHIYMLMHTSFYSAILLFFFKHGPQVVQSIDKEEETKKEIMLFLLKMYSNCKIRLQVRMTFWLTNCFWRTCFVATQPSGSGLTLIRLTGMVGCWASPLRFSVSQDKHTCKQTRALWNNLPQLLKQTANTMLDTVKHSLPHTDC